MAQSQPLPPREAGAAFFNWIRRHGLARGHDSWIAGVASGLARRLGWDANLVRGLFVIAAIFSGLGLLLYGAAWLAMARASDGRAELEDAIRGRFTAGFWGGAITGGVGLLYTVSWLPLGFPLSVFLLVAVGIGAGLVGARAASRPPAGPPWPGPASPPGRPTQTPPPMPSPVAAGAPTPVPAGAPATSPLAPPATGPLAPPPTGALPAPPDRADAAPPDRAAGGPLGGPTGQLGDATATKQLGAAGGPTEEPATMPLDTAATIAPGATATIPPGATATMAPGGPPTIPPGAAAAGPPGTPPTQPLPKAGAAPGRNGAAAGPAASGINAWPNPPVPPRPRRAKGGPVTISLIGLMLLVMAGVVALGRYTDWLDGYALAVLCWGLALVVMGAGLIVLGLLGRRAGSFVAASIILALVAVPVGAGAGVLAVTDGSLSAGSSFSRPQTAAVAANGYSLGIGDLTVDLTDPAILEAGDLTVDVSVGIGNATVVVPGDRSVIVNASLATGQIWAGGLDPDGWSVTWPGLGDGHDWADDYWDGRDWEDRDWVDWDDLSDDPRSVDGIAVSLTAMTEAAADGRQPLLTVDYRGSIGRLRIVEQN